jgi:hypothetical protein
VKGQEKSELRSSRFQSRVIQLPYVYLSSNTVGHAKNPIFNGVFNQTRLIHLLIGDGRKGHGKWTVQTQQFKVESIKEVYINLNKISCKVPQNTNELKELS